MNRVNVNKMCVNYPSNFELPNPDSLTQQEWLDMHPCGQGRDRFPLTPGYSDPNKQYRGIPLVEKELGAVTVADELEHAA